MVPSTNYGFDTNYGLPSDKGGIMEVSTFIIPYTQRRPCHEILYSTVKIILRYRFVRQENICLHPHLKESEVVGFQWTLS